MVAESSNMRKIWGYCPVDYRTWPSRAVPQVQKIVLHADYATNCMQVILSNRNGVMPLALTAMMISCRHHELIKWSQPLCVNNRSDVTLGLDDEILSDPVYGTVSYADDIEISLTLPYTTYLSSGVVTYSRLGLTIEQTELITQQRISQRQQFIMVRQNPRMTYFFGIVGLMMRVTEPADIISVFGDSIVQQGFFTNHLRHQLHNNTPNFYSVINCGIGGNRVLFDTDPSMDQWYRHGIAGRKRFASDLFSCSKPDTVVVLHGINDLIQQTIHPGEEENVTEVIRGLKSYAAACTDRGTRAFIGTLLPLGRSQFFSQAVESKRTELNRWIRSQQVFTGVIDFDQVMKDKEQPEMLRHDADSGDGLHPSDAGGRQMAIIAQQTLYSLNERS